MKRLGRYVCIDCKEIGRGGYFSLKDNSGKCPYCGSIRIRRIGD
jgi:DNA-directed RNA polymerase subunit RPC12/RpoP